MSETPSTSRRPADQHSGSVGNEQSMTGARQRVMGGLFLVSGVCFVAGVLNPPLLRTWVDSVPRSVAVAAEHRTAWFNLGDSDGFIRPHG